MCVYVPMYVYVFIYIHMYTECVPVFLKMCFCAGVYKYLWPLNFSVALLYFHFLSC